MVSETFFSNNRKDEPCFYFLINKSVTITKLDLELHAPLFMLLTQCLNVAFLHKIARFRKAFGSCDQTR